MSQGVLFAQGVSGFELLGRRERLEALKTGDGRTLPAQVGRELDRLELLLEQIKRSA